MARFPSLSLLIWAWFNSALCLDNGLARLPPMGWMSWQRFRCTVNCELYPHECISEWLIRNTTDLLVSEKYADVGYEYVIVDDCWLSTSRDSDGKLQPDSKRFPSGIKALADYVHKKGLKFGIYEDIGTHTCGGYPGSEGHLEKDAFTFAEWGVDYVKMDGCYTETTNIDTLYPEFGKYLNKTGRPMVYSCSWPAYQMDKPESIKWQSIAEHCNLWRLYGDIDDSWESVWSITDYFSRRPDLVQYAGPGHWNDPDMLVIGNFGLSLVQAEAQMALWAVMAAPLLMSTDLANMDPDFKAILQNKQVIEVNQDPLGIQGKQIISKKDIHVWGRPISPKVQDHYSYAIAIVSNRTDGMPYHMTFTLNDLGLLNPMGYIAHNIYRSSYSGELLKPESKIDVKVIPTGVVFLKLQAVSDEEVKGKVILDTGKQAKTSTGAASARSHSLQLLLVMTMILLGSKLYFTPV